MKSLKFKVKSLPVGRQVQSKKEMKLLFLIAIFPIIVYTVLFIWKYGVPVTFSAIFRAIKHKAWFTLVLLAFAIPYMIVTAEWLFMISGALLVLTGTARNFWVNGEKTYHFIGAVGGFLAGFAGLVFHFHLWYVPIPFFIVFFLIEEMPNGKIILKINNHTLYTETVAFATLVAGVFIHLTL